ncbi:hypothetical protein E2C01_088733 [Portunus trituberculatus]|uniref:Uncharacterized protein n=1 Tax=Portunus trituberculatus TaxID=210409 RepID=A0A5B7JFG7_PORTR|nr:hypothetical protein [Portunus trituberculatus]
MQRKVLRHVVRHPLVTNMRPRNRKPDR